MEDQETIDTIRDALVQTEGIGADRIRVELADDGVVLLGAVETPEQATLAVTVAERYADSVQNHLRVDANLREDPTGSVVGDDPPEPRARNQELSVQTSSFQPERVVEDLTDREDVALAENIPWDPPDHPHGVPTESEQRGVLEQPTEAEPSADAGAVSGEGPSSLPDLSQAELEQTAAPSSREEEDPA